MGLREEEEYNNDLVHVFAAKRIAVWELVHGLLMPEGRSCMVNVLVCALKSSHVTLLEAIQDDDDPGGALDSVNQLCYCEYTEREKQRRSDSESDSE
jgi:hypothetical protein